MHQVGSNSAAAAAEPGAISKVQVPKGGESNLQRLTVHIKENFGSVLSPELEALVFRRGWINCTIEEFYSHLQLNVTAVINDIRRRVNEVELLAGIEENLLKALFTTHGQQPAILLVQAMRNVPVEDRFEAILNPGKLLKLVAQVSGNSSGPSPQRSAMPASLGSPGNNMHHGSSGMQQQNSNSFSQSGSFSRMPSSPSPGQGNQPYRSQPSSAPSKGTATGNQAIEDLFSANYVPPASQVASLQREQAQYASQQSAYSNNSANSMMSASRPQQSQPQPSPNQSSQNQSSWQSGNAHQSLSPYPNNQRQPSNSSMGMSPQSSSEGGQYGQVPRAQPHQLQHHQHNAMPMAQQQQQQHQQPHHHQQLQQQGQYSDHQSQQSQLRHQQQQQQHHQYYDQSQSRGQSRGAMPPAPVPLDVEGENQHHQHHRDPHHPNVHAPTSVGFTPTNRNAPNAGNNMNWADATEEDEYSSQRASREAAKQEAVLKNFLDRHDMLKLFDSLKVYTLAKLQSFSPRQIETELKARVCSKSARQALLEALHPNGQYPPEPAVEPPKPASQQHREQSGSGGAPPIPMPRGMQQQSQQMQQGVDVASSKAILGALNVGGKSSPEKGGSRTNPKDTRDRDPRDRTDSKRYNGSYDDYEHDDYRRGSNAPRASDRRDDRGNRYDTKYEDRDRAGSSTTSRYSDRDRNSSMRRNDSYEDEYDYRGSRRDPRDRDSYDRYDSTRDRDRRDSGNNRDTRANPRPAPVVEERLGYAAAVKGNTKRRQDDEYDDRHTSSAPLKKDSKSSLRDAPSGKIAVPEPASRQKAAAAAGQGSSSPMEVPAPRTGRRVDATDKPEPPAATSSKPEKEPPIPSHRFRHGHITVTLSGTRSITMDDLDAALSRMGTVTDASFTASDEAEFELSAYVPELLLSRTIPVRTSNGTIKIRVAKVVVKKNSKVITHESNYSQACKYFFSKEGCMRGAECKYQHDESAKAAAVQRQTSKQEAKAKRNKKEEDDNTKDVAEKPAAAEKEPKPVREARTEISVPKPRSQTPPVDGPNPPQRSSPSPEAAGAKSEGNAEPSTSAAPSAGPAPEKKPAGDAAPAQPDAKPAPTEAKPELVAETKPVESKPKPAAEPKSEAPAAAEPKEEKREAATPAVTVEKKEVVEAAPAPAPKPETATAEPAPSTE